VNSLRLKIAIFFLVGMLPAQLWAEAEFVQTGSFFQASDGTTRVIPTELGIFFYFPDKAVSLQTFSEHELTSGASAFLEYDITRNLFVNLHVGPKKIAIRGSFALKFGNGKLLVNVDNYPNPYCTAIIGDETKTPSMVAFSATTPVLKYNSAAAAALLRANQSLSNIRDIEPYEIGSDNSIKLKGEPYNLEFIGLNIPPPNNPCLPTTTRGSGIYLKHAELKRIKAIQDPVERKAKLAEAIKKSETQNLMGSLVILKIQVDLIIAFDPEDSAIKVIRLMSTEPRICEIQTVDLNKL